MYCTLQNLIDRFGRVELTQLTDRLIPPTGQIGEGVVDLAIKDASELIDSYLEGRYTLPLDPIPAPLARVACDLARYYLHENGVTEIVQKRYESAVAYLKAVSRGEVKLSGSDGDAAPTTSNEAQIDSGGRVFGRDKSTGYI